LGRRSFDDDVSWPINNLLTFYHPVTGDRYSLIFSPKSEGSNEVYFYLYGLYHTGHVLMGYSKGDLGTDSVQSFGDFPDELTKFVEFFQLNLPRFTGNVNPSAGYNWNAWGGEADMRVSFGFSENRGYGSEYAEINMSLYKGPNGKVEIRSGDQRLTVNLTPQTQNDPDRKNEELFEAKESQLYWQNNWTESNINYRGKLDEVYERMIDEGRFGNVILELGGGNDPLSAYLRDKKVVSLDTGVPQPIVEKDDTLFVNADVENLGGIPSETIEAIQRFLGVGENPALSALLQSFDTVVISNLFNYINGRNLVQQLVQNLQPGTTVIVQNDVSQGHTRAFSPKGAKTNSDVLDNFDSEHFDIKHIFGYKPQGGKNPLVIEINKEPSVLEELNYDEAKDFDGTIYLVLERSNTDPAKQDPDQLTTPLDETDTKGGIDLNPRILNLQSRGENLELKVPLNYQYLQNVQIEGFVPVINQIIPTTNLQFLLGKKNLKESEQLLSLAQ